MNLCKQEVVFLHRRISPMPIPTLSLSSFHCSYQCLAIVFSHVSVFCRAATLFCALQESTSAHFPPLFNQKSWSVIFLSIRQRHSLVMSAPAVVQSNAIFPLWSPSDQTDFPVFDWITPHFSWNHWYLKMLSIWIILYILPFGKVCFLKDPLLNISNT